MTPCAIKNPPPADAERRLTTKEAAELLGVKPETVYAYVSRGQLSSRRVPGGRGSTFDAEEVAALARRNRRESAGTSGSGGELSVRTRLTLIESDRYYFRGVDAIELAARHTYEEVAEWLWTGRMRPGVTFTAPDASVDRRPPRRRAPCPNTPRPTDRLRVAAIAAAAADPLRFDLSEDAVLGTARILIPTLVAALPRRATRPPRRGPPRPPPVEPADRAARRRGRPCAPWTPPSPCSSTTTWPPPPSPCVSPRRPAPTPTRRSPQGSA